MNIKKVFQPRFLALGLLSAIELISMVTLLTFEDSKYSYTIRNETKIVPEHIDAPNEEVSDNHPGN